MNKFQTDSYNTQINFGFEYDWTDENGNIILSRWENLIESRWRTKQIVIDLEGKISDYTG